MNTIKRSLRQVAKKIVPIKLYLRVRGVYGRFLGFYDDATIELAFHNQKPAVYMPYAMTRVHNIWSTYRSHPPLQFAPYRKAELCHWLNRVEGKPIKPYIIECEHLLALAGDITNWQWGLQHQDRIEQLTRHRNCRYVFTYSRGLMQHSRKYLPKELWPKLGYLYPTYPAQAQYAPPTERPFTLLVIASRFTDKGVPEALQAFEQLRLRYGDEVRLILVSQAIPRGYPIPAGVTHRDTPRMSEQLKASIFQKSHVLLLPCYSDSAVPIIESFAFGVPVISTRIHHDDEFVQSGVTGYLIDTPVFSYSDGYGTRWKYWEDFLRDLDEMRTRSELRMVAEQIVDRVEHMMQHPEEVAQLRVNARQLHAQLFTPEVRNRQLLDIYDQAIYGTPNIAEVRA